jgi:hypothetical protein
MRNGDSLSVSDKRLSRLAAGISTLALAMILASVLFSYKGRGAILPPDYLFSMWPSTPIYLASAVSFVLMGGLIAVRQPRNAFGWVMLASGFGQGSLLSFATSFGIYAFHVAEDPLPFVIWVFPALPLGWTLWLGSIPLLMLLYPTGRLSSPRWKPFVWILLAVILAAGMMGFFGNIANGWIAVPSPYELSGTTEQVFNFILVLMVGYIFGLILVGFISLLARAWHSKGIERQQFKWFAYAAIVFVVEFASDLIRELPQPWEAVKEAIPMIFLSVATGIAVLRYRLFDIDVIIRKTLVYALLTAALALLYFGLVTLLQSLSASFLGLQSPVIIVLSTLVIAALFNPLRRRLQDLIDRRFYRNKYDAEKALARFAEAARNETELQCLNEALLEVVQETVQPEQVSLWLQKSAGRSRSEAGK